MLCELLTKEDEIKYLNLNGVPTDEAPDTGAIFLIRNPQGAWYPNKNNLMYEVEACCIKIHNYLIENVFESSADFNYFVMSCPEFMIAAGLNSESTISRDMLDDFLKKMPRDSLINRALYFSDCQKLVSNIQECSKEVMQLQGEFYYALNCEELFYPRVNEPDGVRYVTSPVVTKLHALLGFIYIRMHSLLDYTTKLVFECEGLCTNFSDYPRLTSKKIMYSDKKRTSLNGTQGTLFESCSIINEIEAIRNHVIHNGLLDDMPKVYRVISEGDCIEKYLLLPDRNESGRFEVYKNRNLFYSRDDKINERLPHVISEFQQRLINTLELLLEH